MESACSGVIEGDYGLPWRATENFGKIMVVFRWPLGCKRKPTVIMKLCVVWRLGFWIEGSGRLDIRARYTTPKMWPLVMKPFVLNMRRHHARPSTIDVTFPHPLIGLSDDQKRYSDSSCFLATT